MNDPLNGFIGKIKCSCGTIVRLIENREKFQLSNVYRHIVDRRNGKQCDRVEKLGASSTPSPSHTQATGDQESLPFSATEPAESQASSIVSFDDNDLCTTVTSLPLALTPVGKRKHIRTTRSSSTVRKPLKRVRTKWTFNLMCSSLVSPFWLCVKSTFLLTRWSFVRDFSINGISYISQYWIPFLTWSLRFFIQETDVPGSWEDNSFVSFLSHMIPSVKMKKMTFSMRTRSGTPRF